MKTLDLHGVKHVDVMRMVDNFLWESMNTNLKEVEIIIDFLNSFSYTKVHKYQ